MIGNGDFEEYGITKITREDQRNFDNTAPNARLHAETSKRVAERYGTAVSWFFGTLNEVHDIAIDLARGDYGVFARTAMDLHNNAQGRMIAGTNKTTMGLLKGGKLVTNPYAINNRRQPY